MPAHGGEGSIAQKLSSRVHYVADGATLPRCDGSWSALSAPTAMGKLVSELLPISEVESIQIAGDPVRLPAALVLRAIVKGRLEKRDACNFGPAVPVYLRFKDGRCLPMTFFPGFNHQLFHQVLIGGAWLELTPVACPEGQTWSRSLLALKPGTTTRAEFEKTFHVDGGLSVPFRGERYVFNSFKSDDEVLKVNVAFRPKDMTAAQYEAETISGPANLPARAQNAGDVLMQLSPVYLDPAYCD